MRTYATAQLLGTRTHQCDATAVCTAPDGARAYVLLDGIGSNDTVRAWTRAAAKRLARTAAHCGDAESALRALHARYAAEPERQRPWAVGPDACAVVVVTVPGKQLATVAWCGDSRAYLLTDDGLVRLTDDHNLRRVNGGNRNQITSCLGSTYTDEVLLADCGHPAVEAATLPASGRLLLASDGAYEPLEDSCRNLAAYLGGDPRTAARHFVQSAIDHAGPHVDNATVLVADL
ncbi:PP2C family protein-serine/threonine phosphatase [Streptomyces sp. Da 82-17]|uniref:PP2C family protein-serine/threonine phosphatase n=1 Tax=Streptomyces sp. Da 82-17 TaxID=3377116 RepID=UPI0038D3C1AC